MTSDVADFSIEDEIDDESLRSDADQEVPGIQRYEIGFYGTDYPIDALFSRLNPSENRPESDIFIPDFQRGYVWTKPQADRFIESLLLGLPVPGIFLSTERETNRRFVVDGGQRLRTIKSFMEGKFKKSDFVLGKGVHEDFQGKGYKDLSPNDSRRFNDAIIHATIVRQDQPEGDDRSLFYLFERLNTGGTEASPHEVRRCLWGGSLNALLTDLDTNSHWRHVYGPQSPHFKDQELILRFIALFVDQDRYGSQGERTMKDFLSSFMARNRSVPTSLAEGWREIFEKTIECIDESLGNKAFRPEKRLNSAVCDAVMVGLAHALDQNNEPRGQDLQSRYDSLLLNGDFAEAISSRTSHQSNVVNRLNLAKTAFARPQDS